MIGVEAAASVRDASAAGAVASADDVVADDDFARQLRELPDAALAAAVAAATAGRPAVRATLLATWRDDVAGPAVDTAPSSESSAEQGQWWPTSARALLRGSPGGFLQHRPAARINEYWSLGFMLIFNVLLLITVSLSYSMSMRTERVNADDFYISSSIDVGWAHRIGALGLSVAFFCYTFIMVMRYVAVSALIESFSPAAAKRISWLSKFALAVEVIAALGAVGVGAFNASFNFSVHLFFAGSVFLGATISMLLQSFIDEIVCRHTSHGSPKIGLGWRLYRWCACALAVVGLVGVYVAGYHHLTRDASIFELTLAFALVTYYSSWLGSGGTGYIVGFEVFAYTRPLDASVRRLQVFSPRLASA
eukprot:TRINITY_DN24022_c0_g2_i1.p1 TRINITY_DN24022_c0_g2~~TRINITY_DN24022_c0_g2_i1.p1  ORF type:complete len:380 (-),score=63.20 TRINITY_DN24022_c0_g2_i1:124-1215(-)